MATVKETFFVNQLSHLHDVELAPQADFIIDNKFTFEVGGKNKGRQQLKNQVESYLALAEIEYGVEKRIPLWLFGFLY
jgi:hypothetical protein